ncbi:MAG: cation:proton antiporter [Chloroflexi bacterium]|nr:cation:proton antiporter [Chloroflexota bacterium]
MESNPAVALFLAIGLIVAASRIGGTIARRFHQPRVLGELIIGVILGPTLIDVLHQSVFHGVELQETIKLFAELGVLLLMFIVGLEVNMGELMKVGRVGVIAGFAGAFAPVLLTLPLVLLFQYAWQPALFAGVTLAATSVSISAQVLLELGVLRTKVGNALLATALIDDIVAILLVSLTVAITGTDSSAASVDFGSLLSIIVTMALYLVGAFLLAWFILPKVINWLSTRPSLAQSYGIPAFALIALLLFGWSAEELGGMAAITGAFLAGVGFSRAKERVRHDIETALSGIAYTFLVPIFFVDVGLQTDLSTFPLSALPLALLLLVVAVASKIGGCGLGGRLGGFANGDALRLGVCMISRGEVGLIIASLGIGVGVFRADDPLFASLFLVILVSTLITPPLVRAIFKGEQTHEAGRADHRAG